MIWWSALTSVVKGFFDSFWSALGRWLTDKEKKHTARLEVESEEFKQSRESQEKIRKVRRKSPPSDDLNDVLDDF